MEASSGSPLLTLSSQVLTRYQISDTRYEAGHEKILLSDAGGGEEKPSQCQTVSSLVDRPQAQEPAGRVWDLLDDDNTLVGQPSEYAIWRDILVQQKPNAAATSSVGMKTSRTWTQA